MYSSLWHRTGAMVVLLPLPEFADLSEKGENREADSC